MAREIKSILNRLNFFAGRNPFIININNPESFIPSGFKTVLLISADFELAWASRYDKNVNDPLKVTLDRARTERLNVPEILKLCEHFQVPVTWATVGHLFLDKCTAVDRIKHPEIPQVSKYEGVFWDFKSNDWFEHDPCTDFKTDPEWYASDLIKQIVDSSVKHEIGCHTFSHIDCRDEVCSPELIRAELQECKKLAKKWDLHLKTFVHPGYSIGNLGVLVEQGFTNFRTDYRNVLGYPLRHKNGLWEFEQTAELVYRKEWSADYHIYRYKTIIKRAIDTNTVCVFWFHPSFNTNVVENILPEVFKYIEGNRDKIWLGTHKEYVQWLDNSLEFELR